MPSATSAVGTTLSPAPTIERELEVDPLAARAEPGGEARHEAGDDDGAQRRARVGRRTSRPRVRAGPARAPDDRRSPRRPPPRSGWPAAGPRPWRRAGTRRRSTASAKLPCTPNLSSVSLIESGTVAVVTLAMMPSTKAAGRRADAPRDEHGELESGRQAERGPQPERAQRRDVARREHAVADVAPGRERTAPPPPRTTTVSAAGTSGQGSLPVNGCISSVQPNGVSQTHPPLVAGPGVGDHPHDEGDAEDAPCPVPVASAPGPAELRGRTRRRPRTRRWGTVRLSP